MAAKDAMKALVGEIRNLSLKYHQLTGKPLGTTGEIGEYEVADKLAGIVLAEARTSGYDAVRTTAAGKEELLQIKTRRCVGTRAENQSIPRVKRTAKFTHVVLVLLDEEYKLKAIWEAKKSAVLKQLHPDRSDMKISVFKTIGTQLWLPPTPVKAQPARSSARRSR